MPKHQRILAAAILIGVIAAAASCSSIPFRDPGPARPFVRVEEPIPYFEYDREPPRVKSYPPAEETEAYTSIQLKFKTQDFEVLDKDATRMYWMMPKGAEGPVPLMIVMPPTGGPYEIMLYFGRYFAERGYACMVLRRRARFFNPDHGLAYHKALFRQTVIDIRRAIDWAVAQPGVDGGRVGILGVSLGGILSQLAMQADERVDAGAILISGQDLPLILKESGYTTVRRFKKSLLERYGVGEEELLEIAAKEFAPVDPKSYPGRIDPESILMISGRYDNIVPPVVTRAAWENLGHPSLVWIPTGHYTSFFYRGLSMGRIFDHFETRIGAGSTPRGEESHAERP